MERMVVELSPFMSDLELQACLNFLDNISDSKFDINPSVEDSKAQMRLILGRDRYDELVYRWTEKNQTLLQKTDGARKRLRRKSDGTVWDGLDPEDDPNDYEVYYQ